MRKFWIAASLPAFISLAVLLYPASVGWSQSQVEVQQFPLQNGQQVLVDPAFPVINHPASQFAPAIDEGRVVWHDERKGPADIFLKDLNTGEIKNLTHSEDWESNPAIDGDFVVWRDGYNKLGIHGMNLSTGEPFTVTEGNSDVSPPQIAGQYVVWTDNAIGNTDGNVYGYDLAKHTSFTISDAPGNQMDPKIDGHWVVWWDEQERIYLYDLNTGQTRVVFAGGGARLPDVAAARGLVIWQDHRSGDWDIYGYDLNTEQEMALLVEPLDQERAAIDGNLIAYQSQVYEISWDIHVLVLDRQIHFPVTDNSNMQIFPAVSNNTVVWEDLRNHQADVYGFTWQNTIPSVITYTLNAPSRLQVGAFPEGQIFLQWKNHAGAKVDYRIERAAGITGTEWAEIAQVPAGTTTYTDAPPTLGESYWYRVRAQRDGAFSAYSNEAFNSTFDSTPSLDEMYLMTLINEARTDPAAFGYPNYAPVPPLAYNPHVAYSARSHSQSILNSHFQFGHCDPAGRCPGLRAQAVGYDRDCGENLSTGQTGYIEMEKQNQGFLDSEGHRINMLSPANNEFGVGHVYDVNKGDPTRHGQFTEVFCGRPGPKLPALPVGAVIPYTGTADTEFTYVVTFYAARGEAPTAAQVFIDGEAHDMQLTTGSASNGAYRYTTQLSPGDHHRYYFAFRYGQNQSARWPETGAQNYPDVAGAAPTVTPVAAPAIPAPIEPAAGQAFTPGSVTFRWQESVDADTYGVEIWREGVKLLTTGSNLAALSYTQPLEAGNYTWRLQAYCYPPTCTGDASGWSVPIPFTVGGTALLPTPTPQPTDHKLYLPMVKR
ncbi:MAG: CAP domain-containing protein [Caldilineaceae bacterium]